MKDAVERFKPAKRIGAVILSLLFQFLFMAAGLPHRAQAAPGDLDLTFGTNGKVITDFVFGNAQASSVAIQADRHIVAAGYAWNGTNLGFALARYSYDGSLDPSFGGGNGWVTTAFASGDDYASGVAIQADGKIVVAGRAWNGTS